MYSKNLSCACYMLKTDAEVDDPHTTQTFRIMAGQSYDIDSSALRLCSKQERCLKATRNSDGYHYSKEYLEQAQGSLVGGGILYLAVSKYMSSSSGDAPLRSLTISWPLAFSEIKVLLVSEVSCKSRSTAT